MVTKDSRLKWEVLYTTDLCLSSPCRPLSLPAFSAKWVYLCASQMHFCLTLSSVLSAMAEQDVENELLDYDEDEEPQAPQESTPAPPKKDVKGSYVSIHSSGFRDFLLKPELLRAIVDCGFEHPSEVQHECIPQAILGMDVLCQAKSGMGKTAVFVLATLQQIEPVNGQVGVGSSLG